MSTIAPELPTRHIESDAQTAEFVQALNHLFANAISGTGCEREILQATLDAGVCAVGGRRGFLAILNHETGELEIQCVSGNGWTDGNRCMRLQLANEQSRGITGHVALTGQPYITGDVSGDPYYLRYFDDVRSEIAVPIIGAQERTRGVINIDSDRPDAFDAHDSAHLTALAHAAAVSMALEGFRARESALIEIGKTLTGTHEVESLMQKVVDVTAMVLKFEDCSVFLRDDQTDQIVLQGSRGSLGDMAPKTTFSLGEGLVGWIAEHGKPVRVEDVATDPRALALPKDAGIGPFLAVPIVSRDKTIGVLRLLRQKSHTPWFRNVFTESDERLLGTVASQLGSAVENARSFRQLIRAERMAAWGELSARSAHMIGNRTFALKGDLNELSHVLEVTPESPARKELLQLARSMETGVERLEEILREFRDYVVATQVTLADCDINAMVRELVDESFPKRCCVELHLELAESLPIVRCDATRLKRAFSELIENAISFMPDGGEVRIITRAAHEDDCTGVRFCRQREYVVIEFADTGPGVAEDIKDRIFRPFFTSRVKGMGLGLSIVKGIVEAHQGFIREDGAPGKGARFIIYLPVDEPGHTNNS